MSAFQIYRLVYNIRRGPQPYSARRLCEFLLRRQVRLDENGQPRTALGNGPFTQLEFSFLEQATARALMNRQSGETYWRARYLHELALQAAGTAQFQQKLDRAQAALKTAWEKTSCTKKSHDLLNSRFSEVDFLSVLVMIEDLLMDRNRGKEERRILYTRLVPVSAQLLDECPDQTNLHHRLRHPVQRHPGLPVPHRPAQAG